MKKKLIAVVIVILVLGGGAWFWGSRGANRTDQEYRFVEVTRGDLENVVTSTGTLSAVGTVDVGTQVSGIIDRVLVDYNDHVKKGQLMAVLDTTVLSTNVRDAQSSVTRSKAQLEQAQSDYTYNQELYQKKLISQQTYIAAKTAAATAKANLQSAMISLERAQLNLKHAYIKSPIDGTVIQRNVEPGQTVAASFSTPTLFLIAEDLANMEIHALVDESDIGQIHNGQQVRFTVQAYPEKTYSGAVRQIWLQPSTVQNVVHYTVVISARNDDGTLLPGMTATTDFLVDSRKDVLLVPNAALRVQPTPEMLADLQKEREQRMNSLPDSVRQQFQQRAAARANGGSRAFGAGNGQRQVPDDMGRLWYLDSSGKLQATMVRTGVTDGIKTEIVQGRNLEPGMQVISGMATADVATGNQDNRFRGRRGLF